MTSAQVFVGIDVSKAQLDVALRPKGQFSACMRKLLTMLNAMLKNRTPWRTPIAQGA